MALQIVQQPVNVLVPEGSTSVTFSVSGIDVDFPARTVTYQWRRKNVPSTTYVNVAGATSNELTVSPLADFDNDTFVALVSSSSVVEALTSNVATFGVRLSGESFSNFETLTETGSSRRRRLVALGYV